MGKLNKIKIYYTIKKSSFLIAILFFPLCPFLYAQDQRDQLPPGEAANPPTPVRPPDWLSVAQRAPVDESRSDIVEILPYKPSVSSRGYEKKGLESFERGGALQPGDEGFDGLEQRAQIIAESERLLRSREEERNQNNRGDDRSPFQETSRPTNLNPREGFLPDLRRLNQLDKKKRQTTQTDSNVKEKVDAKSDVPQKAQVQTEAPTDLSKILIQEPQAEEKADVVDTDNDGIPDEKDDDLDGDGILDTLDNVIGIDPVKASVQAQVEVVKQTETGSDLDNDGIPDSADSDIDGDGIPNDKDLDADGDGIPDSDKAFSDKDRDGTPDALDDDIDGDGILNVNDPDADGDGVNDKK